MKRLGVIGGMGPMATVYFLQLLTQMSQAGRDQEHMEILLHSNPRIPDRTRYIIGESDESPLPSIIKIGQELARCKAEVIAIPCITACYFRAKLEAAVGLPVIDPAKEAALCLKEAGIKRAGILATDGTVKSGLFQKALDGCGIKAIMPDCPGQEKVMHLIYQDIKAGKPVDMAGFNGVSRQLSGQGAEVVLLACTELSLVKRDCAAEKMFSGIYLDVLEVLARKAVLACGRLKEAYRFLL